MLFIVDQSLLSATENFCRKFGGMLNDSNYFFARVALFLLAVAEVLVYNAGLTACVVIVLFYLYFLLATYYWQKQEKVKPSNMRSEWKIPRYCILVLFLTKSVISILMVMADIITVGVILSWFATLQLFFFVYLVSCHIAKETGESSG